ncbi:alpha/beta fold hydrolase [Oceanidesulfovibrio marinus]|uniref:Alpha/beta hydrolase n=1 Tax=Oceanidesulfovibrio marinus TaxID=370038 RepID=A0A6P1ZFZ8_9BACT|nr:alpha/beta hydrolase [Oceanidesulfovibrio marinus]TVM32309.1 alpha/beta hydrolase [Oceanidesulfovibrio marinus]
MIPCRLHGKPPYTVAVIHGGPGAPGSAYLLARELSATYGVAEPMQSKSSLLGPDGQVEELRGILEQHATLPAVLVGHSWGAMLAWCLAALHPAHVKKLILVGSGLFDDALAGTIMETRMQRLTPEQRAELDTIFHAMDAAGTASERDNLMARAAPYCIETDTFESNILDSQREGTLACQYDLHTTVWAEMRGLRRSGKLLDMGRAIRCPVIAIHGEYDPHPIAGIEEPLARILPDFRFHLLPRCGHYPWLETHARDEFFGLLRSEIDS